MKTHDFYQIKGGVIEGKVMTADEIITLAKLPSREDLLSMLAGALLANISKVAVALNEVKKQKEEAGEKVTVSVRSEKQLLKKLKQKQLNNQQKQNNLFCKYI